MWFLLGLLLVIGKGSRCLLSKHLYRWDLINLAIYVCVAGSRPNAKAVAFAIAYIHSHILSIVVKYSVKLLVVYLLLLPLDLPLKVLHVANLCMRSCQDQVSSYMIFQDLW